MKAKIILIKLFIICFSSYHTIAISQTQIGNTILAAVDNDGTGDTVAISDDGNRIVVGIDKREVNNMATAGVAIVYELNNGQWQQLGQTLEGEMADQQFGHTVEMASNGNRIAVGGREGLKVYDFMANNWQQVGQLITFPNLPSNGRILNMEFSLDGNTIAISANLGDQSVGVLELQGTDWILKGDYFSGNFGNVFGLSDSGDRLVIEHFDPSELWSLKVFDFSNGTWQQTGNTIQPNNGYRVSEGFDISGNGNRIVCGWDNEDGSGNGAIAIFDFSNNDWILQNDFIFTTFFSRFGQTLQLSQDGNEFIFATAEDGANQEFSYAAFYSFENNQWIQKGDQIINQSSDETAQGHADITSDGTKTLIGGNRIEINNPKGFTKAFDYSAILNITNFITSTEITVYPNPSYNILYLSYQHKNELDYQIFDLNGKIVGSGIANKSIDITDLNSGVYFLNLFNNNFQDTIKFIKH